jgi:hypothetical protein
LGECKFIQPDEDFSVIIFVAIFSAIVSTPIALFSDWILQHILSAPTSKFTRSNKVHKKKLIVLPEQMTEATKTRDNSINAFASSQQLFKIGVGSSESMVQPSNRRRAQWTLFLDKARLAERNCKQVAESDLKTLISELKVYRQTLIDFPQDLNEFDSKLLSSCLSDDIVCLHFYSALGS